jgi:UPF0716 family protein affecting phage T7 exclusion
MQKMNIAEGTLVLVGFLLLLNGLIFKFIGFSLLFPMINTTLASFVAANSCFLTAFLINTYDKPE